MPRTVYLSVVLVLAGCSGDPNKAPERPKIEVPKAAQSSSSTTAKDGQSRPPPQSEAHLKPAPGQNCLLKDPAYKGLLVAVTKEGWHDIAEKLPGKDRELILNFVRNGQGIPIPNGTKALVLSAEQLVYEVRLLNGEHQGKRCFVGAEFVFPWDDNDASLAEFAKGEADRADREAQKQKAVATAQAKQREDRAAAALRLVRQHIAEKQEATRIKLSLRQLLKDYAGTEAAKQAAELLKVVDG